MAILAGTNPTVLYHAHIFNWVVFAVIMIKLHTKSIKVDIKTESPQRTLKQKLFVAVGLSLLLGLGWGLGLTATSSDLRELTFALQIIFSVFVGSQGILIFILHGLRSPQFRLVWTSCFGLRNRQRAPQYLAQKQSSGSGQEYNMTGTGTLPNDSSKQGQTSQNQSSDFSSQVIFNTSVEIGEKSLEESETALKEKHSSQEEN